MKGKASTEPSLPPPHAFPTSPRLLHQQRLPSTREALWSRGEGQEDFELTVQGLVKAEQRC
jgi:hypothetical protein